MSGNLLSGPSETQARAVATSTTDRADPTAGPPPGGLTSEPALADEQVGPLERRGRRWLVLAFLACPCHLPVTLALLGILLGGTVLGRVTAGHPVVAGVLLTSVWLYGTARGLRYVQLSKQGRLHCDLPGARPAWRRYLWP